MDIEPTGLMHESTDHFPTGEELTEYVQNERQPIDYSKIAHPTTRVLALGENHARNNAKQHLIDNLEQLKTLGFTHLCLEMIGTDAQALLKQYQETGTGREQVIAELRKFAHSEEGVELYLKAIDEAKKLGLQLVAIDLPHKEQPVGDQSQRIARDQEMSKTINEILQKDSKAKCITYTGTLHAAKTDTAMAYLLSNAGHEVVGVNIEDGGSKFFLNRIATSIGAGSESFMLPLLERFPDSPSPLDWLIHLPPENYRTPQEEKMAIARANASPLTGLLNIQGSEFLPTLIDIQDEDF